MWLPKKPDLKNDPTYLEPRITANESQLAEITPYNNHSTVPSFTNGQLTQVEELDGTAIKKRTTLTYNADGTVDTFTEEVTGKTIVSTMSYTNGEFSSVSKQVIEGGL